MIYLAFYRGEGRFLSDTLVQRITRSEFSHCELFISDRPPLPGDTYRCISAAGKHGGVYTHDVTFRAGAYEFVPVPWAPQDTFERALRHLGKGYDYWGLLMTQLVNMRRHTPDRWFCSKLCARAMGLADAHTYAPGDLKRVVEEHNRTFYAAQGVVAERQSKARPRTVFGGAPVFPGSGTFAGGMLAARSGAKAVMANLSGGADLDGVRAIGPGRVASRSHGLATAQRTARLSENNVIQLQDRIAK
ncbi:hypothetical protein [uncultured Litoreibacter sp.]|uniref:hypothetical protein n=1 Tax=uncultured Litoreibacter sp. TaxID=1392394 RepID=UPI00261C6391|nr:hypothetical protein [uncultured Litoreibacter sp.]